jgi:phage terminase large subunit GpA-like protein
MAEVVDAPPTRTPSEWAKQSRIMPLTSPEPGPVRPERNPYLIEPAAAFTDPKAKRITYVTGTQSGKSFLQENVIGHRLDDDPCPIIYYAPTEGNITKKVEPVMMAMLGQSPSLDKKFARDRSTQYVKRVGAGTLYLSWMGSTTETASTSARLILVDELDRCSKNAEGSVVELVEARGDAYADSRVGFTATPTVGRVEKYKHPKTGLEHWAVGERKKIASPTWRQWQSGTRKEWAIPCIDCHEYFIPWSGLLWWPGKGTEDECVPAVAEREARLCCPNCGSLIEDKYRQRMNKRGRYVAPGESVNADGKVIGESETAGNSHFSYWTSGLCSFSAKKSYGFLAKKLMTALQSGEPEELLPVYNTGFGECYAMAGEAPPWEAVKAMAWKYHSGHILSSPEYLLCTVDVQKNRLVYVVRAWYLGMASALVECGELWGDTLQPDVWDDLAELLDRDWGGRELDEIGIDCGYRDDMVFDFVRRHKGRARALRGDKLDKPYRAIRVDVDSRGKTRKRGDMRWDFDSPRAKSWVHSRVGWSNKKPGFWILPADIDEDYCKQIVGEEFDESESVWKKIGENHYLDCEAMQYMLARMKGLKRQKGAVMLDEIAKETLAIQLARHIGVDVEAKPVQVEEKKPAEQSGQSDWLGGYDTESWL